MVKEMLPFKTKADVSHEESVRWRLLTGRGSIASLRFWTRTVRP
jgi:hypothetical protein